MESEDANFYLFREESGIRLRSRRKIDYRETSDKFDSILTAEEKDRNKNKNYTKSKTKEKSNDFKPLRSSNYTNKKRISTDLSSKTTKAKKRRRNAQNKPPAVRKMSKTKRSTSPDVIVRTQDGYESLYSDEECLVSAKNISNRVRKRNTRTKEESTTTDHLLVDGFKEKAVLNTHSPLLMLQKHEEALEPSPKIKILSNITLIKPPSKEEDICLSEEDTVAVNLINPESKEKENTANLFSAQCTEPSLRNGEDEATVQNKIPFLTSDLMESRPTDEEIMSWIQTGIPREKSEIWKGIMEAMLVTCSDTAKALLTALRGPVPPELIQLVEVFKKIDEETESYFRSSSLQLY